MSSVGDMLRLARQRLGLTQKYAAAQLGVQQPILSRYENTVADPASAFLMKAASAYKVPREFFDILDPVYGPPVSVHTMLRGRRDVTARDLDMITAELNVRLIHLRRLFEAVDFSPSSDVPALGLDEYESPEKIATVVRAHWGVPSGSVKDLTRLAERAGIVVGMSKFGGAPVSGVTFRAPGRAPLILLNENHAADRLRFTLAHELGHIVMHKFPSATMENEANEFASEFLMPREEMRHAFRGRKITIELLAALKPEWRVAMQALLYRATKLGFLTQNQSRYMWQQISSRGWRLREPRELDFPQEKPRVLDLIINAYLLDLGYSLEELTKLLKVSVHEFVDLYGTPTPNGPEKPRLRVVRS